MAYETDGTEGNQAQIAQLRMDGETSHDRNSPTAQAVDAESHSTSDEQSLETTSSEPLPLHRSLPARPSVPLGPLQKNGILRQFGVEGGSAPINIGIHSSIEGFFVEDDTWTCYRRNHFKCTCSFTLNPNESNGCFQYIAPGSSIPLKTRRFFMTISAVDADSNQHIELIQWTSMRHESSSLSPQQVQLSPKSSTQLDGEAAMEHTFELVQFKKGTERYLDGSPQYFQIVISLLAEVEQGSGNFVKIAERRSAKLIVRKTSTGRYPQHGSATSGEYVHVPTGGRWGTGTGLPRTLHGSLTAGRPIKDVPPRPERDRQVEEASTDGIRPVDGSDIDLYNR